jgi:hypothetical protein
VREGNEVDSRAERVAKNEALFREVNERIAELTERQEGTSLPILCECGRLQCDETLTIPVAEYEAIRAHGARFIVLPGHALLDFERVVERTETYDVVEKFGETAEVVLHLDPRRQ